MGYAKITNLYRRAEFIDLFKKVYVTEKIHGTSTHLHFNTDQLNRSYMTVFSGGADHSQFSLLFDTDKLLDIYKSSSIYPKELFLYGEGYGGKMQGMRETYGDKLRFIVFDVKVDDKWLDVPDAAAIAERFNQEFVWYAIADNTIEELNKYRDQPSELAKIRGCGSDKPAEGIVVKPLCECYDKNGDRWFVKHKRAEFCETTSRRETFVDHGRVVIITEAQKVADEFVTKMRLLHVIDKMSPPATAIQDTGRVIEAMQNDIYVEARDEVDWRIKKDIFAKIASNTAKLWKEYIQNA